MAIITNEITSEKKTIIGSNEIDYIVENKGNTVIKCGAGNDTIYASDGDTVYFQSGVNSLNLNGKTGTITVYGGTDKDDIYLDANYEASTIERDGKDARIITDKGLTLILKDYALYGKDFSANEIFFSNNGYKKISDAIGVVELDYYSKTKNMNITGTALNDSIRGSKGSNVIKGGAGNDAIAGSEKGNDKIYLGTTDLSGKMLTPNFHELTYSYGGNDTIYGSETAGAKVGIDAGSGNDKIYSLKGDTNINGGEGNDTIYAGSGTNKILGGEGNDKIYITSNSQNTIFVADNFGKDTVYGANSNTIIDVNGVSILDLIKNKNDLIIDATLDSSITIKDFFNEKGEAQNAKIYNNYLGESVIKDLINAEGFHVSGNYNKNNTLSGTFLNDYIHGGDKNDVIKAGDGDDTINPNKGTDKIYVGKGNDKVRLGDGSGKNIIYGEGGNLDIWFSSINNTSQIKDNISYSYSGNDLIIKFGDKDANGKYKDSVILKNYAKGAFNSVTLEGDDEVKEDINNIIRGLNCFTAEIGKYNKKKDGYVANGTMLNDRIKSIGNDTIYAGAGNDYILLESGGNSVVYAGSGQDTISAGPNNDTIYCGTGHKEIQLFNGGSTTVYLEKATADLCFNNVTTPYQINVDIKGNDLILKTTNDEVVTIKDYAKNPDAIKTVKYNKGNYDEDYANFVSLKQHTENLFYKEINGSNVKNDKLNGTFLNDRIYGYNGNDTIYGGDGTDVLYGGAGNDVLHAGNCSTSEAWGDALDGGAGNDKLYGDIGNTIYYQQNYNTDGHDTIYAGTGKNKIVLGSSINLDTDIYFTSNGNDLIINYDDTDKSSITLANFVKNKGKDEIYLTNDVDSQGTKLTAENIKVYFDYFYTTKSKKITGTMFRDYIDGSQGNDTLNGGAGNDTIYGHKGNDKIDGGAGKDNINGGDGNDTIKGGADNDYIYGNNGNDNLYGGDGNDLIYGGAGNNIIYGDKGNDTIYAWDENFKTENLHYNNKVYGGDGNDRIYSIDDDIYFANSGKDSLYGGNGNDTIFAQRYNNYVDGGKGNDEIHITKWGATSTIVDEAGDEHYYANASYGKTIINDKSGNDYLFVNTDLGRNLKLLFDVKIDKKGNIISSTNKDLWLTDDSGISEISSNRNINSLSNYIQIKNYFGNGQIEHIEGDNVWDLSYIQEIQSNIAGWLASERGNGFTSAYDVLAKGEDWQIKSLLDVYAGGDGSLS